MNADKLSRRLETVAEFLPKGCRMADIGSDHAYLPCYAVKKGMVSFAIAGEVVEGPFQSAKRQVEMEGLTKQIIVRKGNGLEVIEPGEVNCITIAGMGGSLITAILDEGKTKLDFVQRLILQPNISAITIRKWLLDNGWELTAEQILEEDGKIYEILVADKGDPSKPYQELEKGLLFGPFLLAEKSAAFRKKWDGEKKNWQRILQQLEKAAPSPENMQKAQELRKKITMAEEVLEQ